MRSILLNIVISATATATATRATLLMVLALPKHLVRALKTLWQHVIAILLVIYLAVYNVCRK